MKPQNLEERLVWYCILGTYIFYALALQYPIYSTLAWTLFFYLCVRVWTRSHNTICIPWVLWLWIGCMLLIGLSTQVALIQSGADIRAIIRAALNWTREWALLALFPLAGCFLRIRPQLIYRASNILCLQSLILIPCAYLSYVLKLPEVIYQSPLERLTQNGSMFYKVVLYNLEHGAAFPRLNLFAPWSPALGLISCFFFVFALQEVDKKWRWIGLCGSIAMLVSSVSRAGFVALPLALLIVWYLETIAQPWLQVSSGVICLLGGLFSSLLVDFYTASIETFRAARAGSSQLRDILQQVAIERWKESPIWGHGIQMPGPPVLAEMPIGSHHTWFGILFTNGIIGFSSLLIPLVATVVVMLKNLKHSSPAKVALLLLIILVAYSFGENLEKLSYLYWSGLVIVGIALRD